MRHGISSGRIRGGKMGKLTLLLSAMVIACGLTLEASAANGPARLTPENPKWGDTVRVTYDPAVKGAKFLPGDTIYCYQELEFPKFSKKSWAKMEAKDGRFTSNIKIAEGSSFIYIFFITVDGWDQNADLRSMIFRRDGAPAEGAWTRELGMEPTETGYLDAFKNERKLYPDDYLVYRAKWWADVNFKKDNLKAVVGREMDALKKPGIKESPGLLRAVSCGYLFLDDEKSSRKVLRRMVQIYPDSEDTTEALREYDYQAFSKQFQGEGPEEIKRLKLELARKDPTSEILRDYILLWVAYEKDPPLDIVRPGFEYWIKEEPDNPTPYYTLAKVLFEKNEALNESAGLIEKALDRLVSGKWRFFGDFSGHNTERALPDYYATAAAIHENLGEMPVALRASILWCVFTLFSNNGRLLIGNSFLDVFDQTLIVFGVFRPSEFDSLFRSLQRFAVPL
jgi:hypothetical protein